MSDGGKGSSPRPYSVDSATFANNWDAIFGKKNPAKQVDDTTLSVYNDERLVTKNDKRELSKDKKD